MPQNSSCLQEDITIHHNIPIPHIVLLILRHLGPGGPGGGRAPPRIGILLSKNFQNGQNFIFLLFGPPLRKNRSQGPEFEH